jgi:predicted dehydrogenase
VAKKRKKTLKIGVIGVGAISGVHLNGYEKHDHVEIHAFADVSKDNLARAGERYDVPAERQFTDYTKMLKTVKLDGVSVCTPNFMHAPAVIAALNAGVHVLCEKPMAMNAVEAQKMLDAAKAHRRILQIGHNHRFDNESVFAKRQITKGQLGKVYYARVQAVRRRGCPSWGVFGQLEKQGGGGLIDIGVHLIDLSCWLMGYPKPVSVSGQTFRTIGNKPGHVGMFGKWDHKSYTVEDFATALVRFENGAAMNIECGFNVNLNDDRFGIHLVGDEGGVGVYPLSLQTVIDGHLTDCTPRYVESLDAPNPKHLSGHEKEVFAFCDSILEGKPAAVPGSEVIWTQKIIDGIFKSSETGKEVRIR